MTLPIYGNIKNVPNHQPEKIDKTIFVWRSWTMKLGDEGVGLVWKVQMVKHQVTYRKHIWYQQPSEVRPFHSCYKVSLSNWGLQYMPGLYKSKPQNQSNFRAVSYRHFENSCSIFFSSVSQQSSSYLSIKMQDSPTLPDFSLPYLGMSALPNPVSENTNSWSSFRLGSPSTIYAVTLMSLDSSG